MVSFQRRFIREMGEVQINPPLVFFTFFLRNSPETIFPPGSLEISGTPWGLALARPAMERQLTQPTAPTLGLSLTA